MTCPVCKTKDDSSQNAFCPHCAWDLKNDLTLNTYLGSIPEKEMSDYRQRLEIARKNWEYLQRMKESTSQGGQTQPEVKQHGSEPLVAVSELETTPPASDLKEQEDKPGLNFGVERDPFETKEEYIKRLNDKPHRIGEAELIRDEYNVETGRFPLRMVAIEDWPESERDCLKQLSCNLSRDEAVTIYQKSPRWPVYFQLVKSKGLLSIAMMLGTSLGSHQIEFLADGNEREKVWGLLKTFMKSSLTEYDKLGHGAIKLPETATMEPVRKQQVFTKLGHGGVELPDDTFQSQGWLMTLDNRTGLIWEIKTYSNKDEQYIWGKCSTFIKKLNQQHFGGFNDWRLPSRGELESIVDRSVENPAINAEFFPNTGSSAYWSATSYADNTSNAWRVNFSSGLVGSYNKSNSYYVRAVRAGK